MPVWGPILASYLFLAGLSAGAYATAALVSFAGQDSNWGIQRVGRIIAPVAIIIGLVLLMVDAEAGFKNPIRFFYLLSNFNSVMTWGVVILCLFTALLLVSALFALRKKPIPKWFDAIGLFLAFCTAAYTGVLLGVVKTFPLWNNALLPVLFVVSAMSAGLAATMIVSHFVAAAEAKGLTAFKKAHVALPVIELVLIAALFYVTSYANEAAALSVGRMVNGDLAGLFWVGLIIVGIVLPLSFSLINNRINNPAAGGKQVAALSVVGDAGVVAGGFILRYLVLTAAMPIIILA